MQKEVLFNFLEVSSHQKSVLQELNEVSEDLRESTDGDYIFGEQHEVAVPEGVREVGDVGVNELEHDHLGD